MSDDNEIVETVNQFGEISPAQGAPKAQGGALADVAQQQVAPTSEVTKEAAERRAQGAYAKQQMRGVQFTLTVRGDAQLVAKTIIRIEGLGPLHSGLYYVTSIKHPVTATSYIMSVKVRRDGYSSAASGQGLPPTTAKTEAKTNPNNEAPPTSGESGKDGNEELAVIVNQYGEEIPVQTWGREPSSAP
jgi:hypothetical protein